MQEMAFWRCWLPVGVAGFSLITLSVEAQTESPTAPPAPFVLPAPGTPAATNAAPAQAAPPTEPDDSQEPPPGSDAKAYVAFGIANGRKGDLDAAVAAFAQAIKIDPKYAPAYYNQGFAYELQNKLDEAIDDFNKVIALSPAFRDAYYQRGSLYGQKGDFESASKDFLQVTKIDPKYAPAYYNQGHVLYFRGDLAGSLAEMDSAIRLNSNSPFPYFIRGLIRNTQGHRQDALTDFQKSFELGYSTAAFWVWILQCEDGKSDAARQDLTNAAAKPDKFKAGVWPAQVADYLLGKLPANQLIPSAKADNDADTKMQTCQAWFYSAMAKRIAGDKAGAQADFARAISTGSTASEEYLEAQRMLSAKTP